MDTASRYRQGIDLTMHTHARRLSATLTAALLAQMGALGAPAAQAAGERTLERQVAADPSGEVVINNVAGSIDVSAWDQPRVAATADLHGDNLGLEVTSEDGRTRVRVTGYATGRFCFGVCFGDGRLSFNPFGGAGDGGEAHLTVRVPRMSRLDVTAVSADVHSTGVLGAQRLQSVSGYVRAELAAADADVRTVSGDILLRGNGQSAHVTAGSVSGNVTLTNSGGDLQATSISGTLQASLDPAQSVRLRTTSGDITLTGALARGASLQGDTLGGRVSIQARAPDGFAYDVSSFTGPIDDCFGQQPAHNSQYGPGVHMTGTRGAGDGNVHIKTLSGEISLCDR